MHLLCYYRGVSTVVVILLALPLSTAVDVLCTADNVENVTADDLEQGVKFYLYTKTQSEILINLNDKETILEVPLAADSDKVVFVIHGYSESHASKSMQSIRSAYQSTEEDRTVIMVNYANIANTRQGYVKSVCALPAMSAYIAKCIKLLEESRHSDIKHYHLIGFSMGAHMACRVGKLLRDQHNMELDRVTVLDPAKPLFNDDKNEINTSCARFVDVFHSNIDVIGLSEPLGTVDIYVNDGQNQPDCHLNIGLIDFCNHMTSSFLYAATITDGGKYKATRCWDYRAMDGDGNDGGKGEPEALTTLYDRYRREDMKAIVIICSANDDTTRTVVVGENMPLEYDK